MRATRLSLMVLLVVLAFVLWNAAWVTDRCGEWTAALDEAEAAESGIPMDGPVVYNAESKDVSEDGE